MTLPSRVGSDIEAKLNMFAERQTRSLEKAAACQKKTGNGNELTAKQLKCFHTIINSETNKWNAIGKY